MCESILINNKEGRISTLKEFTNKCKVWSGREMVRETREVSIIRIIILDSFMKPERPERAEKS